jgi:hypothetical protein
MVSALMSCTLLWSGTVWAQAAGRATEPRGNQNSAEAVDEVIVRGQRLSDFRIALEAARIRVYDVFNDLNSDDAFDVHCQVEASTGTRTRQHVCRPQFKDDISNAAARAWINGLMDACGSDVTQDCIFSERASQAISSAQAEEGRESVMQKRFAVEMARVVAENPEMQQVILEYQELERAYDDARRQRARGCDRPEPPPRCSR